MNEHDPHLQGAPQPESESRQAVELQSSIAPVTANSPLESMSIPALPGCPFRRADTLTRRLKLLLWGPPGAGKTTLSLQFPAPVVIDLEGGTDLYGDAFSFHVLRTTGADDVLKAVQWLGANQHPYKTAVIDPVTIFWDALQRKWSNIFLLRNRGSKGYQHEFYDFQPRDWMTIKAELKELLRLLIALDMNVIVTARAKAQYADSGFMRVIGETFDGEKSLPYLFDTIIRMFRDDKGRFMGECLKDRSNRLPVGEFECSYSVIEGLLDRDALERPAQPQPSVDTSVAAEIRNLIEQLNVSPDRVSARLRTYGAETIDDLSEQSAQLILDKLHAAAAAASK